MDSGIESIKDIFEIAAWFFTSLGIWLAYRSLKQTRNQFHFDIMVSCITRFQDIVQHLDSDDPDLRQNAQQRYIDLCNEELFYFVNGWLPKEVEKEWLDGMIDLLPHLNHACQNLNDEAQISVDQLEDYPRIRHAFTVTKQHDLKARDDRNELIASIQKQLNSYDFDKHH